MVEQSSDVEAERPDNTGDEAAHEQLGALAEQVRNALDAEQIATAETLAERLLDKYPQSTTAHELMGDVLIARGKHTEARQQYAEAIELEPANVDADRKYAEAVLKRGAAQRTKEILESGDASRLSIYADRTSQGAFNYSLIFPGAGHIYAGHSEKGLPLAVLGMVLLAAALWGIAGLMRGMLVHTEPMTFAEILAVFLGVTGYVFVLGWSAWDARRLFQEQKKP